MANDATMTLKVQGGKASTTRRVSVTKSGGEGDMVILGNYGISSN